MQVSKTLCIMSLLFSANVFADAAPPKHACAKPEHPGKLASEVRMKGFQKEVNDFRECINKFATEQKAQSENHMTALNNAVNEFNGFVQNEMNPKKEE